jgi:hypothetical protein
MQLGCGLKEMGHERLVMQNFPLRALYLFAPCPPPAALDNFVAARQQNVPPMQHFAPKMPKIRRFGLPWSMLI